MAKKVESGKENKKQKSKPGSGEMSYRLKCAKTANGLSHFVMYGMCRRRRRYCRVYYYFNAGLETFWKPYSKPHWNTLE